MRGLAWAAVPLLLGLTLGWWALAAAPEEGAAAGEEVVLESGRSVEDDFYGAGRSVGLLGDVAGDAMVAGENVTVTGSVGGDVLAAGRTVAVEGPVEGDVRVAGQDVIINGRVGRAVTAFGSRLAVAKGASIGRTLLAFGERLEVRGAVGRDLRAFAETVLISGRVAGDVDVEADHLIIAEGARVEGDVRYTGPVKPEVAPGSVAGQVIYRPRAPEARPTPLAQLAAQFLALGRFLLLTLALAFFAGQGIRTLTDRLLARPWRSLGVGALSLVLVPLVVVALALTVVGSSAAWAVALSFVGLVVGSAGLFKAVLAVVVGRWLWRLLGKRWNLPDGEQLLWPAAVGALAVFVLTAVPGLGFLVGLVALLGLLGALLALLWEGAVSWPLRGRP
ncbi:MAG: polymer-forming cytoskeletal protein [Bacillota bacterium]|nr:polymer-forming cytoskeletal protein [Bacillota bacterium]